MNFKEILQIIMQKHNIKQGKLAEILEINQATMSRYLNADIKISLHKINQYIQIVEDHFHEELELPTYIRDALEKELANAPKNLITKVMQNYNLTQQELADILDVKQTTISKYIRGTRDLSLKKIAKYTELLEKHFGEKLDLDSNKPDFLQLHVMKNFGIAFENLLITPLMQDINNYETGDLLIIDTSCKTLHLQGSFYIKARDKDVVVMLHRENDKIIATLNSAIFEITEDMILGEVKGYIRHATSI